MTKQPPAVPLPGPNVTPEPNDKIKGLTGTSTVPGTETKPQDTLQIRKTPWHVTKQPPAVPLPGPNVTPEPNEKIKGLAGNCSRHTKQATRHPSNQENQRNSLPSLCPGQTSLLNRMKKAIVPGTQNKPQDTLQIRKTPWHGVTKQPPAVPLPGPNVTPEPNDKIKGLAGNCSRHTKQATRHPSNQETHWHGVTKQPPAVPLPGPNVTPEPNEKINQGSNRHFRPRHRNQATRHPSNQENTLARRDETASCPEPNEKIKGLAGNCSRHTKQATRHPSNQENTLARRDETASCRPSARAKRHS